ncbi:cation:proton antiporter [Rhodohalobacter barkolensis]|uniref:Sodium:proton antiporter n=1 Tax=Rhodohalobacter barkolensis TaxID=2053187 RepID=A0A2N0VE01_9BACT|nr:cation:proton antiporter [Rhodohalobacter barkolensis]PKD42426.1 sodium:proton antiporter [Rhodohalobacter barkolensis]
MDVFSAAPHHDIFLLVFQVGLLLLAARAFGEVATRLGQPSVIGEILAGIILGPSLLAGFFPAFGELIVPQTEVSGYLLEVISLLGAMFLLLITGLETDIQLIKRHAKTAISVSFGGISITFITGFFLGQHLPDFLLADSDERLVFSLFVATAMAISAIPVIAKVLMDMNLMRRDIGQTILAAGMSDDTIGWILLSIVAGIAAGDAVTTGTVLTTVGSVLAFLILSFTIGRWMVRKLLIYVQDEVVSTDRILSLVIILAFFWGAITQLLNLEAILGAFVMGIIFGMMPRLPEDVINKLESLALGIFAPIFFAVAGLKVNIINLFDPTLIVITLIVIAIATLGKVAGTYTGARFIGKKDHWTSLSFGAGLNARGAMEIIIATIGLRLGILSQDMFSIIVVMAMATSLMAPSALKWVLSKVEIGKEEEERLKKEELEAESLVADIHRVLLPVRTRKTSDVREKNIQSTEAQILELIGQDTKISLTLLTVSRGKDRAQCEEYLDELAEYFNLDEVMKKVVSSDKPGDAIIDEAKKDYDLVVLGATERSEDHSHLFSPIVDFITRFAPCPTLIVQAGAISKGWEPERILVPTNGSTESKNAAELAFFIAKSDRSKEVVALNVITNELTPVQKSKQAYIKSRQQFANEAVNELKRLGEAFEVKTEALVRKGDSVEGVITDLASSNAIDLIVVGTNVRPGSNRLYLGPRVESILQMASCPVIVFNT